MTPLEKTALERRWSVGWNSNEPIKNFFDRLEDCFVMAITQPPAYTSKQMIDKAVTAIQTTGLFPTAILEWNGFLAGNQTWPEFKSHFQDAYEIHLQSGGMNGNNPYHGAANMFNEGDDSIEEINESITNIHLAHNANTEATNFFDRLEDCFVMVITQPPAYTSEQMIDKAVTAIQTTGLFPTAILDWNGFLVGNQTF